MPSIISVHSFRGGTGKSNIAANLATLMAARGRRVGVIDTDLQSPGIHVLFGLRGEQITSSLNDYMWGRCPIGQTAVDVSAGLGAAVEGKVFLIPSSIKAGEIARVLREGFDARALTRGFRELIGELQLDHLIIDTHPGLNEETLLSIALSHVLLIIMRPDHQDFEGTAVTVEVAGALNVARTLMVVNKVPSSFDRDAVRQQVAHSFGCEVAEVLPHADELMSLASEGIFALRYPTHPITRSLQRVADLLLNSGGADARTAAA